MSSDEGNNSGQDTERLAPRPIYRPPVDPGSRQTFGRPAGQQGSFVADRVRPQKYKDQSEFRPHDKPADPVLEEAFGRPFGGTETLQRHPIDAAALAGEKMVSRTSPRIRGATRPRRRHWGPLRCLKW